MNTSEQFLIERLKNAGPREQLEMGVFLLKAGRIGIITEAGGPELLKKIRESLKNFEFMVMGDTGMETIDSGRRISFKK